MIKQLLKILLLIFIAGTASQRIYATGQYGDKLIINLDTVWINSNPLEDYFEKKGSRKIGEEELYSNCTALWRGYVATWKLEANKLFLIRIQTDYCGDNPIDIDISKEFGTAKVFAKWVNQIITRPKGEVLQYVHMGYMSIYEEEIFYSFKNGKLIGTKKNTYLERNNKLIFPGTSFLMDTIKTIILKSINSTERTSFNIDSSCFINISFNENGKLSQIGIGYDKEPTTSMEKIILKDAIEALKNFPKLMRVNHKNYSPPTIQLYFSGHCLKFPNDRKYGCTDE